MGGFFGAASRKSCKYDVFFGTDYHSHLGTKRGGLVFYDPDKGFQRQIHNIENTPFRTKFEKDIEYVHNISFIGDVKIIIKTAIKVFKREGISGTNSDTMQKFEGNKEKINV